MHRAFFVLALFTLVLIGFAVDESIVLRSERRLHLAIVGVLALVGRNVVNGGRGLIYFEVVGVLVVGRQSHRRRAHALRRSDGDFRIQGGRRVRLPALAGDLPPFVLMFGLAGRAPCLLHVGTDHRDNRMIRQPPLARTVIIQNVTKPKLALFHR